MNKIVFFKKSKKIKMNYTNEQSYKKNNLIIRGKSKNKSKKIFFPSRSNTQEVPHNNININNLSPNKSKNKNISLNNNKEKNPQKYHNMTNVTSSLNSDITNKSNSQYYKTKINQYNEIMNQKDKEILELEKRVQLYKEKLNYLKKHKNIYNINTSINSFNLSKTRSSSNVTERNMKQMQSLSKSQAKIKTSFSLTKNIYGNKTINKKLRNENKIRPKSNNYRKPKIDFFNININKNNYKKNNVNITIKNHNIIESNYFKRPKSSKIKTKKNLNNSLIKPTFSTKKENKILTLQETKDLCDKMIQKIKYTLDMVKAATIGE